MTVYVDNWDQPARVGRINGRWSHLTADTPEELHKFAAKLGLLRRWFQHEGTHRFHYDVTATKRLEAISLGAKAVTWREFSKLIADRNPNRSR